MVTNPKLRVGNAHRMVGDPKIELRNHESEHIRAVSEIFLSGVFQSDLSGPSPVHDPRFTTHDPMLPASLLAAFLTTNHYPLTTASTPPPPSRRPTPPYKILPTPPCPFVKL